MESDGESVRKMRNVRVLFRISLTGRDTDLRPLRHRSVDLIFVVLGLFAVR